MEIVVDLPSSGRFVLPKEFRSILGLTNGGRLIIRTKGKKLELESNMDRLRAIQKELTRLKPKNRNMTDELIAERRAEARKEDLE